MVVVAAVGGKCCWALHTWDTYCPDFYWDAFLRRRLHCQLLRQMKSAAKYISVGDVLSVFLCILHCYALDLPEIAKHVCFTPH